MNILGLKKKSLKGEALIEDVVGKFSNMIDQLNTGVDDCSAEQTSIAIQTSILATRNVVLTKSVKDGMNLAKKLADLIE